MVIIKRRYAFNCEGNLIADSTNQPILPFFYKTVQQSIKFEYSSYFLCFWLVDNV